MAAIDNPPAHADRDLGVRASITRACWAHRDRDDFTWYVPRDDAVDELGDFCMRSTAAGRPEATPRPTSFDLSVKLAFPADAKIEREARLQVSSTARQTWWSVTIRWKPLQTHEVDAVLSCGDPAFLAPIRQWETSAPTSLRGDRWKAKASYCFAQLNGPANSPSVEVLRRALANANLFSLEECVAEIYGVLVDANSRAGLHGLLLITGATGSAKSQIAQGLAHEYLAAHLDSPGKAREATGARHPHVLTFEDPIETELTHDPIGFQKQFGVDYTSRQLHLDTPDLDDTVNAALRQKPTMLYVGEIRESEDLARCLKFGGTGHWVIATAHAGSLLESVEKILTAVSAYEPGQRAIWVPKILAVIHLARLECTVPMAVALPDAAEDSTTPATDDKPPDLTLRGLVPTLYLGTPQGVQSLVADGLTSLLPNAPLDHATARQVGTLGRQYFARQLCRRAATYHDAEAGFPSWIHQSWQRIRDWNGKLNCGTAAVNPGFTLVDHATEGDLYGK